MKNNQRLLCLALAGLLCTGCGGGSSSPSGAQASAPAPAPIQASRLAIKVTGAQGIVIALYQALYGMTPGYAAMQNLTAQASANPAGFTVSFTSSVSYLDDAALAKQVLANMNVTAVTVGPANLANLQTVLTQLFAAYGADARGAIIVNLADVLSGLEADPTYSAAALGFNQQLLANQAYAANAANTSASAVPAVLTVALTYTAQATAVTRTAGTAVAFTAHANGAQSYQWFRAGLPIAGATSDTLKINAVAFGDDGASYAVEAKTGSGTLTSQAAVLTVTSAIAPIAVAGCRAITTPGSYVLTADVSPGNSATECISVRDTQSVQLDCAGHTMTMGTYSPPLVLTNVRDFSVKNCKIKADWVTAINITDGVFSGNSWSSANPQRGLVYSGRHATRVVYDNNIVIGTLQHYYSDSVSITNNNVGNTTMQLAGVVVFSYSKHARILGNTLDGGWDGRPETGIAGDHSAGADDGIVLADADDAVIANNLIKNVWDTGIETVGLISNSVMRDNRIVRASYIGIGGWYWSSLVGNTFVRNTVELSGLAFYFSRCYGLRAAYTDDEKLEPADTVIYFKDNVFDSNVNLNPVSFNNTVQPSMMLNVLDPQASVGSVSSLPGESPVKATDFIISNNLFKNNNFGKLSTAPTFGFINPPLPGYVVDGGGNICPQPQGGLGNPQSYYPIVCH